jgi:hypothetical protein
MIKKRQKPNSIRLSMTALDLLKNNIWFSR